MSNTIANTRSATTSPTLPGIITSTSPSNQSSNTSPKKVTYQADGQPISNRTRQSVDFTNMPTIVTTKPAPSVPISDVLNKTQQQTPLCFICELPILSHQCWNTWSSNSVSSPGLLTVTGIAPSANEDFTGLNTIHHEGEFLV